MKKLILTYLTYSLIITLGIAQEVNLKSKKPLYFEVKLTNIDFSIGDTSVQYSLLVEPTGKIDFEEGYDFSLEKTDIARYRFVGKRKNTQTYKDTIISTEREPLKLKSYFPPLNQDSTKFINGYDFEFGWSPHFEYEIAYSYILSGISANKIYQSELDSIVRMIVPEYVMNMEINSIFQIDLKQKPIEIQYIKAKHHYNGIFEVLEKGTSYISKEKEIDMLFAEFEKLNLGQDSHFIIVDGSTQYFIEFKISNTYFAGMRHYLNKNGRIPENAFPWTVRHLYIRNKKNR